MTTVTKVLGNEYDEVARDALREALISLGADNQQAVRGVAGSQHFESLEVVIGGRSLLVEAETYVGLSVTGEADLVAMVAAEVENRLLPRQAP